MTPEPLTPTKSQEIEARHRNIDSLFGFFPFKGTLAERPLTERSPAVQELFQDEFPKNNKFENHFSVGGIVYVAFCGFFLWLFYNIIALILLLTFVCRKYAFVCNQMAAYLLYPFNKCIIRYVPSNASEPQDRQTITERAALLPDDKLPVVETAKVDLPALPIRLMFYVIFGTVCGLATTIFGSILWFFVVTIPSAKTVFRVFKLSFSAPLNIKLRRSLPFVNDEILLMTFQPVNRNFLKYSVGGMSVVLVNMLPFVLLAIGSGFSSMPHEDPLLVFFICMLSIVPLAYYIGKGISMISNQAGFLASAIINASFASIIELITYYNLVKKGMHTLIHASVTGSILGTLVLLPSLSMIFGGIKYKEQKFNAKSASVTSLLMLVSISGAFIPTIFMNLYGGKSWECSSCLVQANTHLCRGCHDLVSDLDADSIYYSSLRPLQMAVAVLLPLAYIVGLIFTLHTHSDLFEGEAHGSDGFQWSTKTSVVILLLATVAFAIVSETLTEVIRPALDDLGLSEQFAGVCIIGIIPNIAEFVSAIQFSMHNNIALSIEIGSSAAMQISLIQIPALVWMSNVINDTPAGSFNLVFGELDLCCVLLSVLIFNYLSNEGKCNYFQGTAMLIVYLIFAAAFFVLPSS
ncbi:hypothetical protein PCE1_003054 [Barthelona sp. PCE]